MSQDVRIIVEAVAKARKTIEERSKIPIPGVKASTDDVWNELIASVSKLVDTVNLRREIVKTSGTSLYVQQKKHDIVFTDTHVFVGCETHTWDFWYKNGDTIAAKFGYSPQEFSRLLALFKVVESQIRNND